MIDSSQDNRRRGALLAGVYLAIGLVVGLLVGLIAGRWWLGALIGLLLAAVVVGVAYFAGPGIILRRIHADEPDTGQQTARLLNLVDGLCVTHGVRKPAVRVIDDPAINAAAVGTDPRRATIAVTTGMLDALSRIELEAVVAHLLSRIRHRDIVPATLAAVLLGGLPVRAAVVGRGREIAADTQAWRMTRYPPGLIGALEKIRDQPAAVRFSSSFGTQLWFADPSAAGGDRNDEKGVHRLFDAHAPVEQRIVLLQEL